MTTAQALDCVDSTACYHPQRLERAVHRFLTCNGSLPQGWLEVYNKQLAIVTNLTQILPKYSLFNSAGRALALFASSTGNHLQKH